MKSPIKFRYVLLAVVAMLTFNSINDALKRSDFNHCLVTSKMSKEQCSEATGYNQSK